VAPHPNSFKALRLEFVDTRIHNQIVRILCAQYKGIPDQFTAKPHPNLTLNLDAPTVSYGIGTLG
jgi:hypothetical protein